MRTLERGKQHHAEHVDSEGSWAISYGDMITLLLSFFVLYFTVDHKKDRASKMEQALMVRLQELGVKAPEESLKSQLNVGIKPGEGVDPLVVNKMGAEIFKVGDRLMVDFPNISFFALGEIEPTKEGKAALEKFVTTYMPFASTHQISIQAFTDTRKVRETNPRYKDNLELSALRSVASMRVMQRAGVPLSRMKIAGYGELIETQEKLMALKSEKDPLKFTRKVILSIEPQKEGN